MFRPRLNQLESREPPDAGVPVIDPFIGGGPIPVPDPTDVPAAAAPAAPTAPATPAQTVGDVGSIIAISITQSVDPLLQNNPLTGQPLVQ